VLVLVRLVLEDRPGALARAAGAIAEVGGDIVAMDVIDRENGSVTDDFVIEWSSGDSGDLAILAQRLNEVSGAVVECVRPTPEAELHRELELITTFAVDSLPSLDRLDLLARLIPAMLRCDWAAVLSCTGSTVGITHSSGSGPRIRWGSLPWLPLHGATTLDFDERWVPAGWQRGEMLALAAAPINPQTNVLVCRSSGPLFRPREVVQLGQLGALAGRLLPSHARSAVNPSIGRRRPVSAVSS
jgi:hypothetical protein